MHRGAGEVMSLKSERKRRVNDALEIVRDAGGKVVGRTRLQKTAYLLELAGVGSGFSFEYRHYGPFSEELANAVRSAHLHGCLTEEEHHASWGGHYSVYTTNVQPHEQKTTTRSALASLAASADPIELELAATAAFLFAAGEGSPWRETAMRKPEKAKGGRLEKAKLLYKRLCSVDSSASLPEIVDDAVGL